MGLTDLLSKRDKTPSVQTLLPSNAVQEIMNGRLPILRTSRLFLNPGENCHFMDNSLFQKENKVRTSIRHNGSYKAPGILNNTWVYSGGAHTESRVHSEFELITGMLFITNQRIIFSAPNNGFVYTLNKLTAVNPYSNAVELQFGNKSFTLFVPRGDVVATVLHILK